MFSDVYDEPVDFAKRLIAGVAVVVVFSLQLAERPAATQFGAVERAAGFRVGRRVS